VDVYDRARSVADQVCENIRRVVGMLLDDRATTKILLTDALGIDAAFDRKLHSFYDEVTKLLVESLELGQELGIVEVGDPRMYAVMTMGGVKELLYQVILRGPAQHDAERIVDEIFTFLRRGYLRVDDTGLMRSPRRTVAASST
jgi:hypothetical protein